MFVNSIVDLEDVLPKTQAINYVFSNMVVEQLFQM